MTFIAAVAAGPDAVADLERKLRPGIATQETSWATHRGYAVAWRAGHPWVSSFDDGDVLVVLDGQLHDLFVRGIPSAALLLRRYRQFGADLGRGLLGDFVCIVLDRTLNTLLVIRDPLGVRPWYQATSGRRHAGATDVATLSAMPWVNSAINEEVALAYLAGAAESRGPTLHRGIVTLAPGSTWAASEVSSVIRRHHRWEISAEPEVSWEEAVHRSREAVDLAVRARLQAADAATSELSGGVDSSSIVGTVAELGIDDLLVGRILYDGWQADEREFSDAVIDHWQLRAVSAAPWIPTAEEFQQLTASLMRPPPDTNFTMVVGLHRAFIEAGRSSAMTGLGGDDAFVDMSYESRLVSAVQQRQLGVLAPLLLADLRDPRQGWNRTWRPLLRYLSPRGRNRPPRYISPAAARAHGITAQFAERPYRLTRNRAVDERAAAVTSGYLAHVLEEAAIIADLTGWRSSHPFLDPRVITATYGLNPWFPVRGGHDRALQIAAFGDLLPALVRERRSKAEFSETAWAQVLTDPTALRRIERGPLADQGWLDAEGFSDMLERARRREPGAAIPLSRAHALDSWLRYVVN